MGRSQEAEEADNRKAASATILFMRPTKAEPLQWTHKKKQLNKKPALKGPIHSVIHLQDDKLNSLQIFKSVNPGSAR